MRLILTVLCLIMSGHAFSEDLLVAAAADLNQVMPVIVQRFEKESGNKVELSFGASGNFFAQIQNGAPFDLFLSADIEFPKRLETAGIAQSNSLYEYARGTIVLWVPDGSHTDVKKGLEVLASPGVKKIAIANPAHAPYGKAAIAALEREHLYEKIKDKLVMGENISQTFELVHSGNADAGIIAVSLVTAPSLRNTGRWYTIPVNVYPPIRQGAVVIKSSPHKTAAFAFIEFLKRPETVALLKQYGFETPESQ